MYGKSAVGPIFLAACRARRTMLSTRAPSRSHSLVVIACMTTSELHIAGYPRMQTSFVATSRGYRAHERVQALGCSMPRYLSGLDTIGELQMRTSSPRYPRPATGYQTRAGQSCRPTGPHAMATKASKWVARSQALHPTSAKSRRHLVTRCGDDKRVELARWRGR